MNTIGIDVTITTCQCYNLLIIFQGCRSPIVVKLADTQKDKEYRKMQSIQQQHMPTAFSAGGGFSNGGFSTGGFSTGGFSTDGGFSGSGFGSHSNMFSSQPAQVMFAYR